MANSNYLDDLLGVQQVTVNGVGPDVQRRVLNVVSASATVRDNAVTGVIDLTLADGVGADAGLPERDPVMDPALTPSADDEDFTTDVFASGEWIVALDGNPIVTTLTRAGNIDPSNSPASGTFRSTLAGSTVWVQGPSGVSVWFYKAMAGALTGIHKWMASVACSTPMVNNLGGVNDPYVSFQVCGNASGRPDKTRRFGIGYRSGNNRFESINVDSGGANVDAHTTEYLFSMAHGLGMAHNHSIGAGGHRAFVFDRDGNVGIFPNRALDAVSGVGFVCFQIVSTITNTFGGTPVYGFHFVRRRAGAAAYIFG